MKGLLKKSIAVLVVVMFVFATACGQQPAEKTDVTSAQPTKEAAVTVESKKEVSLKVLHWRQEDKAGWDYMLEKMKKKYPECKVDVEVIDTKNYYDVRKTRALSGELSDIFMISQSADEKLKYSQYCEDLKNTDAAKATIDQANNTFTDSKGKLMGIDLGTYYANIVFYNKDIYEKLGLSIPKTWAEFLSNCDKISKSGIAPISVGAKDGWPSNMVVEALSIANFWKDFKGHSANQIVDKAKSGEIKYTDDRFKNVVGKYLELNKKGYFMKNSIGVSYDQSVQAFINGDSSMIVSGSWTIGPVKDAKPDFKLGVFAFPTDTANNGDIGLFFGTALSVNKDSKVKDYAIGFLNLMTNAEVQKTYCDKVKQFPSIKGIEVTWDNTANDILKLSNQNKLFTSSDWLDGEQLKIVREKLSQEGLLGRVSVEQWCDQMQKALLEDMKKQ